MGKIKLIKGMTLKTRLIYTYIAVLIVSLIATIVTYILLYYGLKHSIGLKTTFTFHHLARTENVMKSKGLSIFNEESRKYMENFFDYDNIDFQVVDEKNSVKYGTIEKPIIKNQSDMYDLAEMTQILDNIVTEYRPIRDSNKNIKGMVILRYSNRPYTDNHRYQSLVSITYSLLFFIPFAFILLFTFLFSIRLSKKFKKPIHALIDSSKKIQMRDLDFEIQYEGNDEIGQLSKSFEEMRKELKNSLLRQWQLEQERRDMVAALTHDIGTPLTIIQGHVDSLKNCRVLNPNRLEKYLDIIQKNTIRVTGLVKEMNKLSEVDTVGFMIHATNINISRYINEKIDTYSVLCSKKQISFILNVNGLDSEQRMVLFDGDRITQVLDNIITNSIRFTPLGGEIIMNIIVSENKLSFSVSDNGPGFLQEELKNVFRKCFKGSLSQPTSTGNLGLGLFIAKTIVQKHGGSIEAKNRKESGACVAFTIKTDEMKFI